MTTPETKEIVSQVEDIQLTGKWSFLRYLLTLIEGLNLQAIVHCLENRGILTHIEREEIFQQPTDRDKTERCLRLMMMSGNGAYGMFCDALKDCGYNHVVESLNHDDEKDDNESKYTADSESSLENTPKNITNRNTTNTIVTPGTPRPQGNLAVVGVRMSISSLSKDTKASQKEYSNIIQRQAELERHLEEVMKSLDNAKETIMHEQQEKAELREQLRTKDSDLMEMQRKYKELQNAMGKLKETNNKYHDKITRLQIENEELRKQTREKDILQIELNQKQREINFLMLQIQDQERLIANQQTMIAQKLDMIDQLVRDHQTLIDGQGKLENLITHQAEQIGRLGSEKEDSYTQMMNQQKQLNSQQAQLFALQEQLQRLDAHVVQQSETHQHALGIYPSQDLKARRMKPQAKNVQLRPFNAGVKMENSKSTFWRDSGDLSKCRQSGDLSKSRQPANIRQGSRSININ